MKIPKREVVKFVLKSVLHKRKANSQEELVESVNAELRKVDREYSITGRRLRLISVSVPGVKIRVTARKGKAPKRCPSCNSSLKKTWDRNLKGRRVLISLSCQRCGYRGTAGKWIPGKYVFSLYINRVPLGFNCL